MSAVIKGRHLIASRSPQAQASIQALAQIALGTWEQTIAASCIHYINKVLNEMQEYNSPAYSFKDHAKFWSELKGFALTLQFNAEGILKAKDFDELHVLLGDQPVLMNQASAASEYQNSLIKARNLLQKSYNWQDFDVEKW